MEIHHEKIHPHDYEDFKYCIFFMAIGCPLPSENAQKTSESTEEKQKVNEVTIIIPADKIAIAPGEYAASKGKVKIKKVIFEQPSQLKTIGAGAFEGNAIETIVIPDSVTNLGDNALANNALTTVTLGKQLSSMGKGALHGNTALTKVQVRGSKVQSIIDTTANTANIFGENINLQFHIDKTLPQDEQTNLTGIITTANQAVKNVDKAFIRDIAITSTPTEDAYKSGESIRITAIFNKKVAITGKPQITLEIGTAKKNAEYEQGLSTEERLVFTYLIKDADIDTDGISISQNTLIVDVDNTIRYAKSDGTQELALIEHVAVAADKSHMVNVQVYTITFNAGDGTFRNGHAEPQKTVGVAHGTTTPAFNSIGKPTKVGHTLEGWYTEQELTNKFEFATVRITANMTLYAKWTANLYKLTLKAGGVDEPDAAFPDGAEKKTYDVPFGTILSKDKHPVGANAPTRVGHRLTHWRFGSRRFDFSKNSITKDLTVYAAWEPIQYQVSINLNGGTSSVGFPLPPKVQPVAYGKTIGDTYRFHNIAKKGHAFGGWYTDATFKKPFDFSSPITANIHVHAKWIKNQYKVVFRTYEGTPQPPEHTALYGNPITKPTDPTRDGYTFDGWHQDIDGTQLFDFQKPPYYDSPSYDRARTNYIFIHAKWIIKKYDVDFFIEDGTFEGGKQHIQQRIKHKENVLLPKVIFPHSGTTPQVRWYTAPVSIIDLTKNRYHQNFATITKDTEFHAVFFHTVTFETNGGWVEYRDPNLYPNAYAQRSGLDFNNQEERATQLVKHSQTTPVFFKMTKHAHRFDGWYTDRAFKNKFNVYTTPITQSITLYAKWRR